jgi:hypothetical protein
MIQSVVAYYDEPDDKESPEAFRVWILGLVERWKAAASREREKGAQDT